MTVAGARGKGGTYLVVVLHVDEFLREEGREFGWSHHLIKHHLPSEAFYYAVRSRPVNFTDSISRELFLPVAAEIPFV